MKKLNITKEQFEKSRYFTKKYGELEYVSESGKVFKTSKGNVLMFVKEAFNIDDYADMSEEDKPKFDIGEHVVLTDEFFLGSDSTMQKFPRTGWMIEDVRECKYDTDGHGKFEYYVVHDNPFRKKIMDDDTDYSGGWWVLEYEIDKEKSRERLWRESGRKFGRKFNESYENVMAIEKWIRSKIKSGELPGVEKFKGGRIPLIRFNGSNIKFNYVLQQIGLDSGDKSLWSDETEPFYPPKKLIEKIEDWFVAAPESQRIDVLLDALNKVYDKGGIFGKAVDKKLWLDIPNAFDEGEYIIYGKVEIPKIDVI